MADVLVYIYNSNDSNKNEVIILRYRYITFWNTIFVVDEFYLNVLKTHVFFMNKNIILGITNKHEPNDKLISNFANVNPHDQLYTYISDTGTY